MRERFDKTFGAAFLDGVPHEPGVYRLFDRSDRLIYVGKAKDLRRRLAQYRNAGPQKAARKMRKLVKSARRIEVEALASELDACLEEIRLIQTERPKFNVEFAFTRRYPFVGLGGDRRELRCCMTTGPEHFEGEALSFHGAYRGREVTAEAFFAAMRLLELAGHREPKRRGDSEEPPDTYVFAFRQVAPRAREGWTALFRGEDAGVLREMAVALLDRPRARQAAAEVQRDLAAVVAFFEGQARPLREMVEAVGHVGWPVDALLRDPLHARWRLTRS